MIQLFYRVIYYPPVNKILLVFNKLISKYTRFRLSPSGALRIKIDESISFQMVANQTSYVHKLLYWKGPLQFEYTSIFIELVKHCNLFVDIGANTGYYSLLASKVNEDIIVYAFEPAIGPNYYLKENIRLNIPSKISDHCIALSSKIGNVQFYNVKNLKYTYLKYNLSGTSSLLPDTDKQSYQVETTTLDNFAAKQLARVDIIKIDTEGTEDIILEGAINTIRKYQPVIICELLFNRIESKIEAILSKEGYVFFGHSKGKLLKLASLVREKDDGIRDCFFIHSSKLEIFKMNLSTYLL
jgi:FkbM family methyltransferase